MITTAPPPREIRPDDDGEEAAAAGASTISQNQVTIPVSDNSVVQRVSRSSSSSEWSTSDDDDDDNGNKQVVEQVASQAPTDSAQKIINTYNDCTNVTSSIHNTTIYKDGVTVNHNVYCCPATLDSALKWSTATKLRTVSMIVSLLGILLIIFLGLWLPNLITSKQLNGTENESTPIIVTTEKVSQSTTVITPSSSTTITVIIPSSTESSNNSTTENPNHDWKIIQRQKWKAAPPTNPPIELNWLPPLYVIFSETETDACTTTQKCMETVRNIQDGQMKSGLEDIAYNFLVGGDGMVYEGRGWDVQGSPKYYDTEDFDDMSISVSFIGKFNVDVPTEIILQTAKTFLQYGSRIHKLSKKPRLKALRQLSHTIKNPDDNLYRIIETWEGWDSRTIEAFPPRPSRSYYLSYTQDYYV